MALSQGYVPRKPSFIRKNALADFNATNACALHVGGPDCV